MRISNLGSISLEAMQFMAYHGVLPEEREEGNLFLVDFKCTYDIGKAMISDDLADTLDYGHIHAIVAEEMAVPSNLLEHVAGRIASRISAEHPEIVWFAPRNCMVRSYRFQAESPGPGPRRMVARDRGRRKSLIAGITLRCRGLRSK